jgi:hypothetical protein
MDKMNLLDMGIANKKYSKTRSGRDGLYRLDFNALTSNLISKFETDSQSEINILNRIAKEMPEVLNNAMPDSPWAKVMIQLIKFDISTKILNFYEYKGNKYSLASYLKVRGNDEKNMELIITSQLVLIALAISYHKLSNDFEQALVASELLFGCGVLMGEALFENDMMAGSFKTDKVSLAKSQYKNKPIEKTKIEAQEIRKKYPKIKKNAIAKLIYENIGVSESTVRDYLKNIDLS